MSDINKYRKHQVSKYPKYVMVEDGKILVGDSDKAEFDKKKIAYLDSKKK